MSTSEKTIERLVATCCRELLAAYGVELTEVPSSRAHSDLMLCGILGFTGDHLRGAIILAASEGPFERSNPIPGSSVRTWCAELTNQLVGRLKNALVARGVEIYLSTPVVLRGAHLAPLPRLELLPLTYQAGDAFLCVWMELEPSPDLVLGEVVTEVASEGEAFLF